MGEDQIQSCVTAVEKLTELNDKFFNTRAVETARDKASILKEESTKVIEQLTKVQGTNPTNPTILYLHGKVLNLISTEHNSQAEEYLSKAVKLNPTQESWNALGECYWAKGDIAASKSCFENAISCAKNKVSLRQLSMVLRQLPGTDTERAENMTQSVALAKEAVGLDMDDGHSWFVLGNSYLGQFFADMDSAEPLKKSMKAYTRAELDVTEQKNNPDLHFNRATIYKYQEEYSKALDGFATASALDPMYDAPRVQIRGIHEYLRNAQKLIDKKANVKAKRIPNFLKALSDNPKYTTLSKTSVGANDQLYLEAVVGSMINLEPIPQTFIVADKEGTWFVLTVYNAVPGLMNVGDVVHIPAPVVGVVDMEISGESGDTSKINFKVVRVDDPVALAINRKAVGTDKLAKTVLSFNAKSAETQDES